ncbi:aspartate aminotransferase family protein [Spartobacteria bacterium LR76]|nr:aspartate aminotransferase family protein [Spartobacteria bacterium LR76]
MPSVDSITAELQSLDRQYQIHPFTNHSDMHGTGTHIVQRGDGCYFIDETGTPILDGLAGLWCVNVGYNCREIVDAVTAQMTQLPYYPSFFNSTTEAPIRVAEFLAKHAPARLNHTIFSNSGSEANETALKVIRGYWKLKGQPQRRKILCRTYAYHGVTLATTSLTGLVNCQEPFDLPLEGFIRIPGPYHYGARSELTPEDYGKWCLEETRRVILAEGPETIGALFAEPIQGAGGVIIPPKGYLKGLREICREYGILYVSDEVITAFGRVGSWFASEMWDLDPDIICVAKGITSGYLPLGGTMVSDEIAEPLLKGGYFAHGFTYSGHPSCCAAALANLQYIEAHGLVAKVKNDLGPYFEAKLASLASHPAVSEVRAIGLIGAAELVPKGGRDALTPSSLLGAKASNLVRAEGAMVRGIRDLIAISPPLIISREQIDSLFASIVRGLDKLWD